MEFEKEFFLRHIAQTSPFPFLLNVAHAEGIYIHTTDGKRYMDLISGIGVSNIGHRHPKVIAAINEQMSKHLHVMVYGEFIQAAPNLLVKKLLSQLPESLDCCYLVNSGTEANEGALKLARRFTGRTELIAFQGGYHGSTMGALSVSGNESKKSPFRPLIPDVRFIPFDVSDALSAITERTACVIMETIQGDAGVRIPSKSFCHALRKKCTNTGTLLILDEIQCGMGRSGRLFAYERFGLLPDILTVGKAFGGGLPLGAFISSGHIMNSLTENPTLGHITTFGGNPVSCAAGLAALEVILDPEVLGQVERKGALLEKGLNHPLIKEVRRAGLMLAVDFESDAIADRFINESLKEGLIIFHFLSTPHSVRLSPPFTINDEEINLACGGLLKVLDRIRN